jgi:hypothetical protein
MGKPCFHTTETAIPYSRLPVKNSLIFKGGRRSIKGFMETSSTLGWVIPWDGVNGKLGD